MEVEVSPFSITLTNLTFTTTCKVAVFDDLCAALSVQFSCYDNVPLIWSVSRHRQFAIDRFTLLLGTLVTYDKSCTT